MSDFIITLLLILSLLQVPGTDGGIRSAAAEYSPVFSVAAVDGAVYERISGISWKQGCPVPITDLRLLKVSYIDFEQVIHEGELICHRAVAVELAEIFKELFFAGFPIESIRLIDEYGGDDALSMDDNNTSAFNYRAISGSSNLSRHAYGVAIDINPVQNPYIEGGGRSVSPSAGREYIDRGDIRPGMITPGSAVHRAFVSRGWTWGGDWKYQIDYQHFQKELPNG